MAAQEYIRGSVQLILLRLLVEQERMYGYQMLKAIENRTEGAVKLSYGALYPALHKLEEDGLLAVESQATGGRLRKYYTLTDAGRAKAASEIDEYVRVTRMLLRLMLPEGTS